MLGGARVQRRRAARSRATRSFELGHYLFDLFVLQLPGFVLIAVLALAVHTLVNNKYLGHFIVGCCLPRLVAAAGRSASRTGSTATRARPTSSIPTSTATGHFLPARVLVPARTGRAFARAAARAVVRALGARPRRRLAQRGWRAAGGAHGRARRGRSPAPRRRCSSPPARWIFYNTHVLNPFRRAATTRSAAQAEYERTLQGARPARRSPR